MSDDDYRDNEEVFSEEGGEDKGVVEEECDAEEEEEDGSDEDEENEEEAARLPKVVREEIHRRKESEAAAQEPPNPLAVHELRKHFESGKSDPMMSGGFMTLMRDLGAVAQSKDHLVKHKEHNIWYFGGGGSSSSQPDDRSTTQEMWQEQIEKHESEVRLLRYGEFIETQETRGLSYDKKWHFADLSKDHYDYFYFMGDHRGHSEEEKEEEDDDEKKSPPSHVDDWEVTKAQYDALYDDFINAFYRYTNHDRLVLSHSNDSKSAGNDISHRPAGNLSNNSSNSGIRDDLSVLEIEDDGGDSGGIIARCAQLRDLYKERKQPLGPASVLEQNQPTTTKNISGKKIRKRQRQQRAKASSNDGQKKGHSENIQDKVHRLCAMLEEKLVVQPPSGAVAQIVSAIFDMLAAAVISDVDIARCFAAENGAGLTALRLREKALQFAKEADADELRQTWAADAWWQCYAYMTTLVAGVIVSLTGGESKASEEYGKAAAPVTADETLAARFFETSVLSPLLESVKSRSATERCAALDAICRAVWGLSMEVSMSLVKQKNTWDLFEESCRCRHDDNKEFTSAKSRPNAKRTRTEEREERMAYKSAAQATLLVSQLCIRGMVKDENGGPTTSIVPGPLARKMFQRGIVPLLMNLARSETDSIATEALKGLARISKAQACRTILLQESGTVDLLQSMLVSTEGNKVSQTMLLIVHLLWDDEWRDHILSIEPPVEETSVKWGALCLTNIRNRADEARKKMKKLQGEFMAKTLSKVSLSDCDNEQKENLARELKKLENRLKKDIAWNQLETQEACDHVANLTLSRCLMVLSTMIKGKNAPERVLTVNGLAFGAACLDVPINDTNSAAANVIGNYVATVGACSPLSFPDPEHVVSAAITRLSRLVNRQDMSSRSFVFVRLLNGLRQGSEWAPYFQACSEQDIEHKYVIEVFLPKIGANIPAKMPPKKQGRAMESRNATTAQPKPIAKTNAKLRANKTKNSRRGPNQSAHQIGNLAVCDNCEKTEVKPGQFKSCSMCFVAKYCSRTCQKEAWKRHKKECSTLATQAKDAAQKGVAVKE